MFSRIIHIPDRVFMIYFIFVISYPLGYRVTFIKYFRNLFLYTGGGVLPHCGRNKILGKNDMNYYRRRSNYYRGVGWFCV